MQNNYWNVGILECYKNQGLNIVGQNNRDDINLELRLRSRHIPEQAQFNSK